MAFSPQPAIQQKKKKKALAYFRKKALLNTPTDVAPCPQFEGNKPTDEGITVSSLQFANYVIEPIQVKNTPFSFGMFRAQRETI